MENKEMNRELELNEMKRVSGGCTNPDGSFTPCYWEKTGNKVKGSGAQEGITFWEYKCIRCGAVEYFRRNPNPN